MTAHTQLLLATVGLIGIPAMMIAAAVGQARKYRSWDVTAGFVIAAVGAGVPIVWGLTWMLLAGGPKEKMDAEVRRLCAIDGGVKVYETAPLAPELLDGAGRIRIPAKTNSWPMAPYYSEYTNVQLLPAERPPIWRSTLQIYRRADGKLMGESIRYVRRGGDLPGPWHGSSFSCPGLGGPYLEPSIFVKGDGQ